MILEENLTLGVLCLLMFITVGQDKIESVDKRHRTAFMQMMGKQIDIQKRERLEQM